MMNATSPTSERETQEALVRAEKLATIGRLAATLAHEVNNPLQAASNMLFLVERAADLRIAKDHARAALQQLNRVAHYIHQTLSYSKFSGRQCLVDLAPLIENVLSLFENKIQSKNAHVSTRFRPAAKVRANASEIEQVISNLLSNALDAVQDSGTVWVRLSDSAREVRLVVADNGCGISKELFPRLFDAFFTTKPDIGTGLGLWVSKQIIAAHGGSIRVRSTVGKGTVLRVVLRAAERQYAAASR